MLYLVCIFDSNICALGLAMMGLAFHSATLYGSYPGNLWNLTPIFVLRGLAFFPTCAKLNKTVRSVDI